MNPAPCAEENLDFLTEAQREVAYQRQQSQQSEKSLRGPSVQSMTTADKNTERNTRCRSEVSIAGSTKTSMSNRQMSILDKKSVFMHQNDFIHEDMSWIVGQENTGSLCVTTGPKKQPGIQHAVIPREKDRYKSLMDKSSSKLCKGSVAHQIYCKNNQYPLLSVRGGRYFYNQKDKPNFLRTQNKYSQRNLRRAGLTTPDPNYRPEYRLPPLEQMNITGRMNSDRVVAPVPVVTYKRTSTKKHYAVVPSSHRQIVK